MNVCVYVCENFLNIHFTMYLYIYHVYKVRNEYEEYNIFVNQFIHFKNATSWLHQNRKK